MLSLFALSQSLSQDLVVVHGDCPTGADAIVDRWTRRRLDLGMIKLETFPAQWGKYGKGAGPRRNALMIDAGADMTIGFLRRERSAGTQNCLSLSRIARIPTHIVTWHPSWPEPTRKATIDRITAV